MNTQITKKNNWMSVEEKRIILAQFFPKNATEADMKYCMNVAKGLNLNPILKEIYFVERKKQIDNVWYSKIEPVIGRDSYLTIAHRSGKFDGFESFCEIKNVPTLINGEWQEKKDLVATCKVYRSDKKMPFVVSVSYKEYLQRDKKGNITSFWRDKPETMLKKVAESQALRKAFNIQGAYTEEEIESVEIIPEAKQTQEPEVNNIENLFDFNEDQNTGENLPITEVQEEVQDPIQIAKQIDEIQQKLQDSAKNKAKLAQKVELVQNTKDEKIRIDSDIEFKLEKIRNNVKGQTKEQIEYGGHNDPMYANSQALF